MTGEASWVPPEIDTTVPNPARVYDFWLDGDHNFAADRALGERILEIMPGIRDAAPEQHHLVVGVHAGPPLPRGLGEDLERLAPAGHGAIDRPRQSTAD